MVHWTHVQPSPQLCGYAFNSHCHSDFTIPRRVNNHTCHICKVCRWCCVVTPALFAKAWVIPGSSQPTPERWQLLRHHDVVLCVCRSNQRSISGPSVHARSKYGRCWRGGYADGEATGLLHCGRYISCMLATCGQLHAPVSCSTSSKEHGMSHTAEVGTVKADVCIFCAADVCRPAAGNTEATGNLDQGSCKQASQPLALS